MPEVADGLYPRYLATVLGAARADTPVVALTGARQTGKSTLVRALAPDATYLTLDDAAVRSAAAGDPAGFLAGLDGPVILDEVQRAPDLLVAIKDEVFENEVPGQFILTGSADVMTIPTVAESLAGRMELHTLWPLAESEIQRARPSFLSHFFRRSQPAEAPDVTRAELIERLLRGGYPEAVRRPQPARRAAWFRSYVNAVIQRDLREISDVRYLDELPRIVRVIADAAPGTINVAALAREAGIPRPTLHRYLSLLEQVFLLRTLRPWHANVRIQQVRSPRLLFGDTGILASLLGLTARGLAAWDVAKVGGLLENFVAMEIVKLASWEVEPPSLYHWRTRTGEVDVVIQRVDGMLGGIEVKAASTVVSSDFRHLRRLREASVDRWIRGIVLYTGAKIVPFAPDLSAWPIGMLWSSR